MFTQRWFRVSIVVVSATVALLLSACSGRAATDRQSGAAGAATASDALVIYTYDAFPQSLETLIAAFFETEYGFVPTLERFQDTGELFNQTWLERDDPQTDVVIGLDNTYIGRALEDELFQAYRPAGADQLLDHLILDPEYRLTPFDWGHVVLNYDSQRLPDPPVSWDELLDPRLAESIIVMNPATSSPGRNFLLLTIAAHGEEGYLEFWEQLKPNILTVTSGWSEGYGLYTQGEASIVLSYESSPAYHLAFEDTERYRNLILDDMGYAQIEVAGIVAGARNLVNAQRLLDFLLSIEFQRELPLNQFMYPVRDDVALPEPFTLIDTAGRTVQVPLAEVDQNFERWLAAWQDVMR